MLIIINKMDKQKIKNMSEIERKIWCREAALINLAKKDLAFCAKYMHLLTEERVREHSCYWKPEDGINCRYLFVLIEPSKHLKR